MARGSDNAEPSMDVGITAETTFENGKILRRNIGQLRRATPELRCTQAELEPGTPFEKPFE